MSPARTARRGSRDAATVTGADVAWAAGGAPHADLLPPEVRTRRAVRALRRRLTAGLVLLLLATAGGAGWALLQGEGARNRLTRAENESDRLAAQLASFRDVIRVQDDIDQTRAAIVEGMRNEVLWADLVRAFELALPDYADVERMAIAVVFDAPVVVDDAATPFVSGSSIGSITWDIRVPALEQAGALIQAIDLAPGLFDATYTRIARQEEDGMFLVTGTVRIDETVRSGRFSGEVAS